MSADALPSAAEACSDVKLEVSDSSPPPSKEQQLRGPQAPGKKSLPTSTPSSSVGRRQRAAGRKGEVSEGAAPEEKASHAPPVKQEPSTEAERSPEQGAAPGGQSKGKRSRASKKQETHEGESRSHAEEGSDRAARAVRKRASAAASSSSQPAEKRRRAGKKRVGEDGQEKAPPAAEIDPASRAFLNVAQLKRRLKEHYPGVRLAADVFPALGLLLETGLNKSLHAKLQTEESSSEKTKILTDRDIFEQ